MGFSPKLDDNDDHIDDQGQVTAKMGYNDVEGYDYLNSSNNASDDNDDDDQGGGQGLVRLKMGFGVFSKLLQMMMTMMTC